MSRPGAGGLGSDRAGLAVRRDRRPGAATGCSDSSSTAAGSRPWRNSSTRPAAARARSRLESGQSLARLWRHEGRFDEVRRLLRDEWARAADPSRTLRDLWMLDAEPVPIEMVRGVLDKAAGQAPDDDRVWLGRANLATWSGRFEEADRWLKACLERRPRDPAVWRARLDWARAAGRVDVAEQALSHLPADRLDPVEALELRAWFAAATGRPRGRAPCPGTLDRGGPRRRPAPGAARDPRLRSRRCRTAPANSAGARPRSTGPRKATARLLAIDVTTINLRTVARLAESLGRWFEARGWWSLVLRRAPDDREARAALDRLARRADPRPRGPSLTDLIVGPRRRPEVGAADLERSSPPSPRFPTTPRRPDSGSPTTTDGRRPDNSPRPWAVGSDCSTTTATAGSTSTASRGDRSRPRRGPVARGESMATACSATGATGRSRM